MPTQERFRLDIRKFLKHVGVTSQREIEKLVRSGEVKGGKLKLRMTDMKIWQIKTRKAKPISRLRRSSTIGANLSSAKSLTLRSNGKAFAPRS
jgi:hypothetical protein